MTARSADQALSPDTYRRYRAALAGQPPRLGALLLQRGAIGRGELETALRLQRRLAQPLGRILTRMGALSAGALESALAEQHGIARVDLDSWPPDPELMNGLSPEFCLRHGLIPWRREGARVLVATHDPAGFSALRRHLPFWAAPVLTPRARIEHHLARLAAPNLSRRATRRCPGIWSARSWARPLRRPLVAAAFLLMILLAATFPRLTAWLLFLWVMLTLGAVSFTRLAALRAQLRRHGPKPPAPLPARPPVVSVLVPLYKEARILPMLIKRLKASDYPHECLDILLILEAGDDTTRSALATLDLPRWMRVVEVPRGPVQTKPRAMNYALSFCRGEIVGIYDAEDAPEPDQIRRIVARFRDLGPEVACIQGYLDFYNARENWLSRCFTIEYAMWFRVMLHGIERLRLPVPLGGTSVFFRRAALERLGAWDAHNVTEDADLGFRLARMGYRCAFLDTVTHEEANHRPLPWIRQRSRWLKGYAMTWITHMRSPRALWRDLGPRGFLAFQVILLGTLSSFALAPVIWSLWLITFGTDLAYVALLPWQAWWLLGGAFVSAEAILTLLGFYAVSGRGHRHLVIYVPTMILYWPLGTLAVYKALYELLLAPFYWDKTAHGLSAPDAGLAAGADQ